MTPTKQKIIDEIIIEIESGKGFTEVCSVICSKFQFTERTFAKRWNEANEAYKAILNERRALTASITTQAHIEAIETAIWGRAEKLEILRKIAVGETEFEKVFFDKSVPKKISIKPDASDRMKAIEIHNKMQGDNAPEETKGEMQLVWKEEKTYEAQS
jgi:hypothetical protein